MNLGSLTCDFLRLIGSPYTRKNSAPENLDIEDLYKYATKNRIRLLYLNTLAKYEKIGSLQEERKKLLAKYNLIHEAFIRISNVLEQSDIEYAFFKSIRPYQEVTADIDTLIFGQEYERVLSILKTSGYSCLGTGPLSTTFEDVGAKIGLDIYAEVGVSHLVYMDKSKLADSVFEINISGYCNGRSLKPEADLLAVIAHSIIKEHIYVLSEYYTTLYYLKDMNYAMLSSFVSLAKNCKLLSTAQVHLSITAFLHYYSHGFVPKVLSSLIEMLGTKSGFEASNVGRNGFRMPHKYHPTTIARTLAEKLEEPKARKSFAIQMKSMLNPEFTSPFLRMALNHVFRETY